MYAYVFEITAGSLDVTLLDPRGNDKHVRVYSVPGPWRYRNCWNNDGQIENRMPYCRELPTRMNTAGVVRLIEMKLLDVKHLSSWSTSRSALLQHPNLHGVSRVLDGRGVSIGGNNSFGVTLTSRLMLHLLRK